MRERYTLQRTDSVKPMGGNEISKEGLNERLEEDFSFKSELNSTEKLQQNLAVGKNRWNHEFEEESKSNEEDNIDFIT